MDGHHLNDAHLSFVCWPAQTWKVVEKKFQCEREERHNMSHSCFDAWIAANLRPGPPPMDII